MHFSKHGLRDEVSTFSQIPSNRNMDYHKKMVAAPPQNCKHEDDDDDVEALRFAALQSLRTAAKDPLQHRQPPAHQGRSQSYQGSQSSRPYYNKSRGDHFSHRQQRQNGTRNNYAQKNYRNPNLIEIVPVVEVPATSASKENVDAQKSQSSSDGSKFQRYVDDASGSEDDDVKDIDIKVEIKTEEKESTETEEVLTDKENESGVEESPKERTAEEEEEDRLLNDDDDDVLLMADLEEEVSLDRLMDEMEREIKDDKIDVTEKKPIRKQKSEQKKAREQKKSKSEIKPKEESTVKDKPDVPVVSKPSPTAVKPEPRPVSPRPNFRRRSMSPKPRLWRKTSPRRSPRRSPMRMLKKPLREMSRYRSPPSRYSPRSPRLSPCPRSPRMSPRRSPNRSPMRRSPLPLRKLSPRGRSPRLSPRPRSPRMRSRSPRSRSRSPRLLRSPRRLRSRSPRYSPHRYSPRLRSRSPRSRSPRSPRRRLSRSRSPRSPRRGSPRLRSPRMSPRRLSPRYRSPRGSPRRSPWSSPRRSPRMSPKRTWSPRWSPKDGPRKPRPKSITPEKRSNSPQKKDVPLTKSKSPDSAKLKPKRETLNEKSQTEPPKEPEPNPDPVLEARKRKFESQTPIDPINANKKIKLSNKKEEAKKPEVNKLEIKKAEVKKVEVKKPEPMEETEEPVLKVKKINIAAAEYNEQEEDLCLDTTYEFGELEEEVEEEEQEVETNSAEVSLEVEPMNQGKKRKKKKDKEIYQVGKLKGDVPLGERVVKEKKFQKRKVETVVEGTSEVETVFEDAAAVDEEGDLRAELSRRRAERLNRNVPMQSARLLQSAFKGVVNEVAKNNAKVNQRHVIKGDEKPAQKEVRRVTVLHRSLTEFHNSEEEATLETKVPVRLRLGINKTIQETRETKVSRKSSKRQGRKTPVTLLEEKMSKETESVDDKPEDQNSKEIKENQQNNQEESDDVLYINDYDELYQEFEIVNCAEPSTPHPEKKSSSRKSKLKDLKSKTREKKKKQKWEDRKKLNEVRSVPFCNMERYPNDYYYKNFYFN